MDIPEKTAERLGAGLIPPALIASLAFGIILLKGPIIYPYPLSWLSPAYVVFWLLVSIGSLAFCRRRPLFEAEKHSAGFILVFLLLPALLLLEISGAKWPAEPGTGMIYKLTALVTAFLASALGMASFMAVAARQRNRERLGGFLRAGIPYLAAGAYHGHAAVFAAGAAMGLFAWFAWPQIELRASIAWRRAASGWLAMSERKRTALLLAGLFLVSFALRIAPGYYIFRRAGYIGCGIDYYEAAAAWLQGNYALPLREPGVSLFFYLAMLIGGQNFLSITVAQCLLGALAPVLCYLVARRCFPAWFAWSIAVIACCYGRLIVYSYFLGSENLQLVTVLAAMLASLRCLDKPGAARLSLAGLLWGLSGVVKPTVLPLAAAAFLVICWRKPLAVWLRAAALGGAACLLVLGVWLGMDFARSGGTPHFKTRFINEFVLSNHPLQVDGIRWEWDRSRNAYDILRQDYGFVGENPEAQSNNLFTSGLTTKAENLPKVIRYRLSHIGGTLSLIGRKWIQLYFRPFICPEKFDFQYLLEDTAYYWFGRAAFLILSVIGIALLRFEAGERLRGRLMLAMAPITYMVLFIVFSPSPRNNMPALSFMLMFALHGFFALYRSTSERIRPGVAQP